MYNRRMKFLALIVTLVSLGALVSGATLYYVRPTTTANVTCPGQPCLTLNHYYTHSETYFKSNTAFVFLAGLHRIDAPVLFKDVGNITLSSYSDSTGNKVNLVSNFTSYADLPRNTDSVVVDCFPVLEFQHINGMYIQGLTISSSTPGASAVVLNQTTNAQFRYNWFTCSYNYSKVPIASNGLVLLNSYSSDIYFTYVANCSNGISLKGSRYIVIHNLTTDSTSMNGVYLNLTLHVSVSDIISRMSGITIERSHNTTIVNTNCFQSFVDGMVLIYSNFTNIQSSTFYHSGLDGIRIEGSQFITISNTTANYNYESGIYLHNAKYINIDYSILLYNFNGIVSYDSGNISVSHTEITNSSGHSSHRLGSGMWMIRCHYLYISNVVIQNSTLDGIAVGAGNNILIENTMIKESYFSGILLDGSRINCIKNVTVLHSYMDIEIHDSVDSHISGATVSSTEVSRGLSLFLSHNIYIEDVNFLSSSSNNPPSMYIPKLFSDSIMIMNSTNATLMKVNLTALQRGITVYTSKNIVINRSNFTQMKPLTFESDPTSLSSVIMLYYSSLTVSDCSFTKNVMTSLKLVSSDLELLGTSYFIENIAQSGPAFILLKDSFILLSENSHTTFTNNHATDTGGVFYIDTNFHYSAKYVSNLAIVIVEETMCFLLVKGNHSQPQLTFTNNTAGYGGNLVYGGQIAYGWDGDRNCLLGFKNASKILQNDPINNLSLISSSPSRVCLCTTDSVPDCFDVLHSPPLPVYPGQTINISAVLTGQNFGTVAGSVHAQFLESSSNHPTPQLKSWQYTQGITQYECTNLSFTIYSNLDDIHGVLILTADDSHVTTILNRERVEKTIELWKSTLYDKSKVDYLIFTEEVFEYPVYVNVTLSSCPLGFQLTDRPPHRCDCTDLLQSLPGVECSIQQQVIIRSGYVWVGVINKNNQETVTVSEYCPVGYCHSEKWEISLNNTNTQCRFKRAGILCGGCQPGLSLTLGSNHCEPCTNTYLVLLIPFGLAGIALVLFIKCLDLTIKDGSINALILYANIVQANKYQFFSDEITPLTVFIAWLNLDIGVETCFYNGLTAYAKAWLEFVFPLYIWMLAGIIIGVAKHSRRAATLMGNNSVHVLATLFLLSYAKLLSAIITSLSYRVLSTPHGSRIVWAADGNVNYVDKKHTPLFIAALVALLFLWLPYTVFLFLCQWLYKCNCHLLKRLLIQLKPFLDVHYGPFKGNHRYWFGVLLLARAIILLISALFPVDKLSAAFYSTSIMSLLLLYVALMVYRNMLVMMFEASFFVNLGLLAQTGLLNIHSQGKEKIAVNILVGIAFTQFLVLVFYKISVALNLKQRLSCCMGKKRSLSEMEQNWEKWKQAALLPNEGAESEDEVLLSPSVDIAQT